MEPQQPRKRRKAKDPVEQDDRLEKFLFVDSSDQQGTSKPDRASRSFVMQQARKQKTWSTKKFPTNSAAKRSSETRAQERAPNSVGSLPWVHYAPKEQTLPKGKLIVTPRFGRPQSGQPNYSCRIPFCNGDFCNQSHYSPSHAGAIDKWSRRQAHVEIPTVGAFDPFGTLPVGVERHSSVLINHYSRCVVPLLIPVDIRNKSQIGRDEWLASAVRDEARGALTHTILCGAAMHRFIIGVGPLDDVFYHKAEAVSKINANLSDPRFRIHDNNIAAVFNLLNFEDALLGLVSAGGEWQGLVFDPVQMTMHQNGLRAMLEQRGGLRALKGNKCLQAFILWHSIAHSIATFERPYATLTDAEGHAHNYTIPASHPRPSPVLILRLLRELKIDADLQDIVADASSLASDMASWLDHPKCALNPVELQKHGFLVLQRCIAFLDVPHTSGDPFDQCLCLAIMIFVIRITQPADCRFRSMVSASLPRLRAALKQIDVSNWSPAPDILMWVLTIGMLAAQGSQHFDFFTQYFAVGFTNAGFDDTTSCEEVLERMKKLLWHSSLMDKDAKRLWAGVGIATAGQDRTIVDIDRETDTYPLVSTPEGTDENTVCRLTSARFFT